MDTSCHPGATALALLLEENREEKLAGGEKLVQGRNHLTLAMSLSGSSKHFSIDWRKVGSLLSFVFFYRILARFTCLGCVACNRRHSLIGVFRQVKLSLSGL